MTVLSSSYALALISSSQGIISDASVSYRLIVGALSAAVVFCAQRGASKYQRIASMHCFASSTRYVYAPRSRRLRRFCRKSPRWWGSRSPREESARTRACRGA